MKSKSFPINRRTFLKSGSLASMAALAPMSGKLTALHAAQADEAAPSFSRAVAVWAKDRQEEMNVTLVFSAAVEMPENFSADKPVIVRMTGSTIARIMVNGELAGYGPARGPHGWFRVDEWEIQSFLKPGKNLVTIEVAGYNSNSFYHLDQPSFLQAEIVSDNAVLAATAVDGGGFEVADKTGVRIQKIQRFSFQRPFTEAYDLRRQLKEGVTLAQQPEAALLPRRVPYPEFTVIKPAAWGKCGTFTPREVAEGDLWRDRSLIGISDQLKGYPIDQLDQIITDDMQKIATTLTDAEAKSIGADYKEGDVQIVDFGANYAGFFELEVDCPQETTLVISFDEILNADGDVDFHRLGTCAAIPWTLPAGQHKLLSFEPNVCRYAKIHCMNGSFTLRSLAMREYAYPALRVARFESSNPSLDKLFRAGVLTFRENSVDAFTDCPHRERAGWLCDSFFTSRVACDVTGNTDVEDTFFEDYLLPKSFKCLPDGMLPMCYPADHYDGVFIPSWSLWFVLELAEYARRTPNQDLVKKLQDKVTRLFEFFAGYENSDGLLEKLPSWVFVEWSEANNFVQDVNYPNNMLYAKVLADAGELYKNDAWIKKAEAIRAKIIEQSFDGEFFVDNALRKEDGTLEVTRNRTEVCQYFAFFFKTATPQSHPELWAKLLDQFGPHRLEKGLFPEIHKANSFVGNVLRLELISWAGRPDQLLEESVAYNEYMADRTGTLWENDGPYASCNHGFASHICHVLYRDILGLAEVDVLNKAVKVHIHRQALESARGVMPVPGGEIKLAWKRENDRISYDLDVPQGWAVEKIVD